MQTTLFDVPEVRSPLKYYGGKKQLIPHFQQILPELGNKICSPFLGGGALELWLSAQGVQVHASDHDPELINFWHVILEQPAHLVWKVTEWFNDANSGKLPLYKLYPTFTGRLERAAAFWIINRKSWSGLGLNGVNCDHKPISCNLGHYRSFIFFNSPNLSVMAEDFRKALEQHANLPAYLDPPYVDRSREYGLSEEFDHVGLCEILRDRKTPWILSYGNHPLVYELYDGFKIQEIEWTIKATPKGSKYSKELLITNGLARIQ